VTKYKHILLGVVIGAVVSTSVILLINRELRSNYELSNEPTAVDTILINAEPEVQIERVVERVNVPSNDTVMLLTNINQEVDSGDYVVLRDKLLISRKVNIVHKNKNNSGAASDVLIDKISSDELFGESIVVEFWESPIDYQGYRLNKSKLILFGINPNESFELVNNYEGHLVMTSGGQTALLYATEKYRSFTFK
jgi:hypothetical protein